MAIRFIPIFYMLTLAACASNPLKNQDHSIQDSSSPRNAKSLPLWECAAEGAGLSKKLEYVINATSEDIAVTAIQAALLVDGHASGLNYRMSPDVTCRQSQIRK